MPMEETTTAVTAAATVALLQATMATVAAAVVPLEVTLLFCDCNTVLSICNLKKRPHAYDLGCSALLYKDSAHDSASTS